MRRSTRQPSGPTVTEVEFGVADVRAALVAYAEAQDGPLPNGPVKVTLQPAAPGNRRAVLEVKYAGA